MKKEETYIDGTVSYIKKNLQKGYNRESLKWALMNQGKPRMEIDRAFKQADAEIAREDQMARQHQSSLAPQPMIEPIKEEPKRGFFSRLFGI
jgi:SOS response regulatory protein OraA/RecX